MHHTAVVQDDERLIEPIAVPVRIVEDLLAPVAHRRADLLTKRVNRYRIEQRCDTRPGKHDAVLAADPPNDERIAVSSSHQGLTSVVEIPQWRRALVVVLQNRRWEIGSLQVLGPVGRETVESPVDCLQGSDLTVA